MCKNHNYCNVEMPGAYNKMLKSNQEQKSKDFFCYLCKHGISTTKNTW